jgi:hypothetical protein
MYDNADREFVTALYVGASKGAGSKPESCQVMTVYVMTEDGKTVDTIHASRPPTALTALWDGYTGYTMTSAGPEIKNAPPR